MGAKGDEVPLKFPLWAEGGLRITYGRQISLCGTVLSSFRLLRFEVGKAWGDAGPALRAGGAAAEPPRSQLRWHCVPPRRLKQKISLRRTEYETYTQGSPEREAGALF